MRLTNLALQEMTEAMNRGWGARDTRVVHAVAAGARGPYASLRAGPEDQGSRGEELKRCGDFLCPGGWPAAPGQVFTTAAISLPTSRSAETSRQSRRSASVAWLDRRVLTCA